MPGRSWDPVQYSKFLRERSSPLLRPPRPRRAAAGDARRRPRLRHGGADAAAPRAPRRPRDPGGRPLVQDAGEERRVPLAGLRFEQGTVEELAPGGSFDLVFSNAALHFVEGHEALWPRLASLLAPGGQLAVHVPANQDHATHVAAREVAREEPFAAPSAATSTRPTSCRSRPTPRSSTASASPAAVRLDVYTPPTRVAGERRRVGEGVDPDGVPVADGPGAYERFLDALPRAPPPPAGGRAALLLHLQARPDARGPLRGPVPSREPVERA